jgi:hypothetical protein
VTAHQYADVTVDPGKPYRRMTDGRRFGASMTSVDVVDRSPPVA